MILTKQCLGGLAGLRSLMHVAGTVEPRSWGLWCAWLGYSQCASCRAHLRHQGWQTIGHFSWLSP